MAGLQLRAPVGSLPRLWRPDSKRAVTLEMEMKMKMVHYSATKVPTDWPAGVAAIDWPKDLILKEGRKYLVKRGGGQNARKITMRLVPKDLPTDAHRIEWMDDKGCIHQAKTLLISLMEELARARGDSRE